MQSLCRTGRWQYSWYANGQLQGVVRADGREVSFEYDPLGHRTAKIFDGTITRFVWDGNTPLHDWDYALADRPQDVPDAIGWLHKDAHHSLLDVLLHKPQLNKKRGCIDIDTAP